MDMFGKNPAESMEPRPRLLQAALALLADNGQTGGLRGLVERFEEAGLGNVIQSWIGTGENVPITAEQLHEVLREGQIRQVAEETGMDEQQVEHQLSDMLPKLVDTLTPAGHIPAGGLGNMSTLLDHFIGRFL
jgi:uncharacterized protein YidB (DUF937 family)